MRDRINVQRAIRLWSIWRNWSQVARRMVRPNGMPYTSGAVQKAVRKYDLEVRT